MKNTKKRGFTIVELVIVIAVIAILASVLIPTFSGVVTKAKKNAALADALSTAIFVAGKEKGQELLKKYDARGIFITDDTVYFSKSLEKIFKQQDFSYKYEFMY